jgi:hypothetical protein
VSRQRDVDFAENIMAVTRVNVLRTYRLYRIDRDVERASCWLDGVADGVISGPVESICFSFVSPHEIDPAERQLQGMA